MIGTTISHNRILEVFGECEIDVVCKARDTCLDPFVAFKFLPSDLARNHAGLYA